MKTENVTKDAGRKAGKFLEEFKKFAMRGNVIDMAVGVVIGGAFGKISGRGSEHDGIFHTDGVL